jgi:hypothetical protein
MSKNALLFLIILIEGYVVLAVELLTIRQLMPFVGNGVEVVAIIISGVLLPLAAGYHYGGIAYQRIYARAKQCGKIGPPVRKLLLRNLLIALFILTFGLSYLFLEDFFGLLAAHGIYHRLWQTLAYTLIFLVMPVFCLGQTVPLISHYFSNRRLSEITGKMLFFSTTGSFLGSVFSALVLMMTVGVHNTVIFTLALLALLCIFLSRKKHRGAVILALCLLCLCGLLNSGVFLSKLGFVNDNAYNLARVVKSADGDATYLMLNRSYSSEITADPHKLIGYFKYVNDNFIATLPRSGEPRDILAIGAGGFTMGRDDTFNRYTFVDIDPDLKKTAEDYFLPEKVSANKQFIPSSARAYLMRDTKTYDLVVVDVFQNYHAMPMECTTREFMEAVKAHLKPGGIVVVNVASTPDFRDKFSVRYDRTFSSVFPVHTRQIMSDFNPWQPTGGDDPAHFLVNTIYTYFNTPYVQDTAIYSDDKNPYSIDVP